MTDRVTLIHDTLPGQPIDVDEAAVPHHERAGWRVAESDLPRYGEPLVGIEHPADGTLSPEISNEPADNESAAQTPDANTRAGRKAGSEPTDTTTED